MGSRGFLVEFAWVSCFAAKDTRSYQILVQAYPVGAALAKLQPASRTCALPTVPESGCNPKVSVSLSCPWVCCSVEAQFLGGPAATYEHLRKVFGNGRDHYSFQFHAQATGNVELLSSLSITSIAQHHIHADTQTCRHADTQTRRHAAMGRCTPSSSTIVHAWGQRLALLRLRKADALPDPKPLSSSEPLMKQIMAWIHATKASNMMH